MAEAEEVSVFTPAKTDQNGDPIGVDGAPCTVQAVVWPRTSTEDSDRGVIIIQGLNMKLPAGDPIAAVDVVTARGEDWDVDGVPGVYLNKAVLVVLKKVGT